MRVVTVSVAATAYRRQQGRTAIADQAYIRVASLNDTPDRHGWYLDAEDRTVLRYWNGKKWSETTRPATGTSPDTAATESVQGRQEVEEEQEVNQAGVVLALLGAVLLIVATFLPHVESNKFFRVQDNSLIQSGDGWILIGLAVGIGLATWAASQRHKKTWAVLILALIAAGVAIYEGTGSRVELTSVGGSGASLDELFQTEHANPGLGIWVAGAGAVLAGLGGILLAGIRFGAAADVPARRLKKCPDCAETVLGDARVCKHCGYRFEEA